MCRTIAHQNLFSLNTGLCSHMQLQFLRSGQHKEYETVTEEGPRQSQRAEGSQGQPNDQQWLPIPILGSMSMGDCYLSATELVLNVFVPCSISIRTRLEVPRSTTKTSMQVKPSGHQCWSQTARASGPHLVNQRVTSRTSNFALHQSIGDAIKCCFLPFSTAI